MEDKKDILKALFEFNKLIHPIIKNNKVAFNSVKYSYANLLQVIQGIEEPLRECGLYVFQTIEENILNTNLIHMESGQSLNCRTKIIYKQDDPQGYGSGISYARRYTLLTILGLVMEDDDGKRAASGRPNTPLKENDLNQMIRLLQQNNIKEASLLKKSLLSKHSINDKQLEILRREYNLAIDRQNMEYDLNNETENSEKI